MPDDGSAEDDFGWLRPGDQQESRLQALFAAGIDGGASARLAALEEARSLGIEGRLIRLFEIHDRLEQVPEISRIMAVDPSTRVGMRVGGFTLREVLASGGSADVYLARQDSPSREVVLKIRRARAGTRGQIRRFLAEAERIAEFSHPGVAHVYGSGVERDAEWPTAWIAMERIHGISLAEWRDERQRGWRERCMLVARIAAIVADAHDRGLIHRDLAPRNIIVVRDCEPRILDFGIARTLHSIDEFPLIEGTPEFASPEQQNGVPTSFGDDVYALGRIVGWIAPDAPAVVRRMVERCCGDAARRPTAREVSESLAQSARPREWIKLALLSALMLAAVVAAGVWLQARRSNIERDAATVESARAAANAAAVERVLDALLASATVAKGGRSDSTMLESIDKAEREIRTAAEDAPRVRSMALTRLGDLWGDFGEYRRAHAAVTEAALATDLDPAASALCSARLRAKAALSLAFAGDSARSREAVAGSREELRSKASLVPDGVTRALGDEDAQRQADYAQAHVYLALAAKLNGDLAIALELTKIAEPFHRTGVFAGTESQVTFLINYAKLEDELNNLTHALELADEAVALSASVQEEVPQLKTKALRASILSTLGRLDEAETVYKDALAAWTRIGGENHPATITALNNLGLNMQRQDRTGEAIQMLEEACRRALVTHGEKHQHTIDDHGNLALAYQQAGRINEAAAIFEKYLAIVQEVRGSPSTDECDYLLALGRARLLQKRDDDAKALFERVLQQAEGLKGAEWNIVHARNELKLLARKETEGNPQGAGASERR